MQWLDRLIKALVAVVLLAGGGGLFAFVLGWQGKQLFGWLTGLRYSALDGSVLAAVFVLAALYLLATLIKERQDEGSIIQETDLGQVEVSLKAIVTLVKRAARDLSGVRELSPVVRVDPKGLDIQVTAQVDAGLNIPALATEIQQKIQNYLLETVGYPVHRVKVDIKDVRPEPKARID